MIVRIVKLSFEEDKVADFLDLFEKQKNFIMNFDGCSHLELLRDLRNPNIFFTYSYWDNDDALKRYRESDFFKTIWKNVKLFFNDKPEAWSLEKHA